MYWTLILGLCVLNCFAHEKVKFSIFPAINTIKEGEELVFELRPEIYPLLSCTVQIGDVTLDFGNDTTIGADFDISYWGQGLANGECGVHIRSYNSSLHEGDWLFTFSTSTDGLLTAQCTVSTTGSQEIKLQEEIIAEYGTELEIPCSPSSILYCTLRRPNSEVAAMGTKCSLTIPKVTISDIGLWKCHFGASYSIEEQVTVINVTASSRALIVEQQSNKYSVTLSCDSRVTDVTFCRMERPDGKMFVLSEGRIQNRYSYFGRGIGLNDCGIEIRKPLYPEDVGMWKCTVGFVSGFRNSDYLKVQEEKKEELITEDDFASWTSLRVKQSSKNLIVLKGSPFTMKCSVNSILDYCYFEDPDGERIDQPPENSHVEYKDNSEGLDVGHCGITVNNSRLEDSGSWICSMGVDNISTTINSYRRVFNVRVTDTEFIENTAEVTTIIGGLATLECHSLHRQPLRYCCFTAPNGATYNVTPPAHNRDYPRYNYHGEGIENGDCGILISPVANEDFGVWQCKTMLNNNKTNKELSQNIIIVYPNVLTGPAIGAIVGCVVMFFAACGYFACSRVRTARHKEERGGGVRNNIPGDRIRQKPFTITELMMMH